MAGLVECVPNFSEGRDNGIITQITDSIAGVDGITILDVDPGKDTNRTVVTFVGEIDSVEKAIFEGIQTASRLIDMSKHKGAHPRMGATDVCPFIPVSGVTVDDCVLLSERVGKRVGEELKIPVYLYEHSAKQPNRRNLPVIRDGEYEGLAEKLNANDWKPDFGPAKFNSKSGATVMGCRDFLIAYNINLNTKDTRLATDIAFELREKGRSKRIPNPNSPNLLDGKIVRNEDGSPVKVLGMYKDVKAIGWYMDTYSRAQISINFNNYKISSIHDVFDSACKLATERGIRVTGSELVGLIPLDAVLSAGKHYLKKQNRTTGVSEIDIIESAVQSLGLNDVGPFKSEEKIIEYAVKKQDRPLVNMTVTEFTDELASNSPAPGGGSVSALAGSLAAGLTSMVAALSHEKKEYLDKKPMMEEIGVEAQRLKDELHFLIDEDTHAFNKILSARRLPVSTDEEKIHRSEAILDADIYAIEIPLRVAETSISVLKLAEKLVHEGNPNSVSDAGVAGETALAAVRGACMNILINLAGFSVESSFAEDTAGRTEKLISEAEALHKNIFSDTLSVIESL
ncbi:MAG: glutamate formimidoyltransferase [Candidatus Marinimicrobia bacterium]|nr:glutamate formimidoyltransferase [Candidatus Neomarinimicrobiota bacterium]|tara:strand:- start:19467 stop:21173 length:1707 start_codon:yes stop_codon:yes gene_type:complete